MIKTYKFKIEGSAARGQTWETSGKVADLTNDLRDVVSQAMKESFNQLTKGQAVFGQPGIGCSGPYGIRRLVLEETAQ